MAKISIGLSTLVEVTVAAAGTAEPLAATPTERTSVVIQARQSNVGDVYIGDSTVDATNGVVLNSSNPTMTISVDDTFADEDRAVLDLADIYVNADNNGDGVRILSLVESAKSYNN